MKFSERDIQRFIWENRNHLFEMIQVPEFKECPQFDPFKYQLWELQYYNFIDTYRKNYENLKEITLLGYEVSLPKNNENTIRTDFLGYISGNNGFVVCELKINRQPERQAYTELLAYANYVKGAIYPMGKKDIIFLLISPMEERIVREATLNMLLNEKQNVIALIPETKDTLQSTSFKLWMPSKDEFKKFSEPTFAFQNIDIIKVVWKQDGNKWSPTTKGKKTSKKMIERLNHVSAYTAQLMESEGINGFVYCSQLSSNLRDLGYLDNSIIIGAINPYKATKTKHLYDKGYSLKEAAESDLNSLKIKTIFPALNDKKSNLKDSDSHLLYMGETWSSCIDAMAFKVIKRLTQNLFNDKAEIDFGTFSWDSYLNESYEDLCCSNYDIYFTGLLRELYEIFLDNIYGYISRCSNERKSEIYSLNIVKNIISIC